MSERLIRLRARRAVLIARIQVQRGELYQRLLPWRRPLAMADRAWGAFRYLQQHPAVVMGIGFAVAVARPRRALIWVRRGWLAWGLIRRLNRSRSNV